MGRKPCTLPLTSKSNDFTCSTKNHNAGERHTPCLKTPGGAQRTVAVACSSSLDMRRLAAPDEGTNVACNTAPGQYVEVQQK